MAVGADSCVDGGLGAAVADGFDLLNGVGHLHQPPAAGKQPGAEIRPQAEAHDGDAEIVDHRPELVDLILGQELAFVHNDHVAAAPAGVGEQAVQVCLRPHHLHRRLKPDAAAKHRLPVPGVGAGLEKPDLKIGFAGAHGAVFEVELGQLHFLLRCGCLYYTGQGGGMQVFSRAGGELVVRFCQKNDKKLSDTI